MEPNVSKCSNSGLTLQIISCSSSVLDVFFDDGYVFTGTGAVYCVCLRSRVMCLVEAKEPSERLETSVGSGETLVVASVLARLVHSFQHDSCISGDDVLAADALARKVARPSCGPSGTREHSLQDENRTVGPTKMMHCARVFHKTRQLLCRVRAFAGR